MLYKLLKIFKALRPKEIILVIICSVIVLISTILYIGYFINTQTIQVPAYGGRWREGVVGQPVFVNPVISSNEIDHDIANLIFDDLEGLSTVIRSEETLAKWTVRLKEDLKWSDGKRITSDDIIFTFDTITNSESRSPLSASFYGARAMRVSELETTFILPSDYAFFGETLSSLRIIPKHIFINIPPANFGLSLYAREPIGSGPYKFRSYAKEANGFINQYIVTINHNYHGKKPYINDIIFKFYNNEDDLIRSFNNNDIDGFALSDPSLLDKIAVMKSNHAIPAKRYYTVFLNPVTITHFENKSIREALSLTVPRDQITENIFKGFAKPSFGPLIENTLPYKDVASNALDGLELRLSVPDVAPMRNIAEKLKTAWEAYGAIIHISILRPSDVRLSIRNRDYDALLFGNILNIEKDLYSFWHSTNRFYPNQNLAFFNNKDADLLMKNIRGEADETKRETYLKEISNIITNNIGAIFIVFPDYLYVTSPRLKGFEAEKSAMISNRFNNVSDWYLNTHRKLK